LLKGPRALIFDEAKSSVDPVDAEQLAKTINALRGRVTILVIAHQLPRNLQVSHIDTEALLDQTIEHHPQQGNP
jgi:ATP-binding cassette, subfamily B, bacterial HlyB/CyaB